MTDQAIDKLISEGYDIPREFPKSDDSKKQKLLECIHMGNSKQYLGKVYTEDQINKLSLRKLRNYSLCTKPNYRVRW